jgi:hypothetical protein
MNGEKSVYYRESSIQYQVRLAIPSDIFIHFWLQSDSIIAGFYLIQRRLFNILIC